MNDLVLSQQLNIVSTADPEPLELLYARQVVQADAAVKKVFQDSDGDVSKLAKGLQEVLGEGHEEVAQYLADEYVQVAGKPLIVSVETGKAIYIVSEEDLYTPPPVAREGSDRLVARPPQLRPEIEAALIYSTYEKERETRIVETLKSKYSELVNIGEKALIGTRAGRKAIVESLSQDSSSQNLLSICGGTSAAFLRHFELVSEPPLDEVGGMIYISGTVSSRSIMGVQDPVTMNLYHNRALALRGVLVQGWVREIAASVGQAKKEKPVNVSDMNLHGGTWVMDPGLIRAAKEVCPRATILPVYGPTYNILGEAGYLRVPPAFRTLSTEIFDRWEASAYLDYEIWIKPEAVMMCNLVGLEDQTQVLLVKPPK